MATYYDANLGAFIIDRAKMLSIDDRQAIRDDIDNQCGVGVVFVPGVYVPTQTQQVGKAKTNGHTKTPHIAIEFANQIGDMPVVLFDGKPVVNLDRMQITLHADTGKPTDNELSIRTIANDDTIDNYLRTNNPNEWE